MKSPFLPVQICPCPSPCGLWDHLEKFLHEGKQQLAGIPPVVEAREVVNKVVGDVIVCDTVWYYVILCNILWYSDSCTRTHIYIYIYAYTVCHSLQDLQTKPASAWLCVYIDITRHWICYLRTCMFPPMARPHMQATVSKGHIPTPGLTQSRWWWPHGVYIYIHIYIYVYITVIREIMINDDNHDKSW